MILYKYTSMESAIKIISSNALGFSLPRYFNDPFDIPNPLSEIHGEQAYNDLGKMKSFLRVNIWSISSVILCLTRSANNPLMWSHYADSHRGAVIAIDAHKAGFLDEEKNMIPAHFGSMIYVRSPSNWPYYSKREYPYIVGNTHHFVSSHYERLQRVFLTKPLDWAYEEEIRVIKCVTGMVGENCDTKIGKFSIIKYNDRDLHAFHIPAECIAGVYVGMRSTKEDEKDIRLLRPDIEIKRCKPIYETYSLEIPSA